MFLSASLLFSSGAFTNTSHIEKKPVCVTKKQKQTKRCKNNLKSISNTTTTTLPKVTYYPPTNQSDSLDYCKLEDKSYQRNNWPNSIFSAWPVVTGNLSLTGVHKIAMIPLHFSDLPADKEPLSRVRDQMKKFTDYYFTVSGGKVRFEWVTSESSILMPGISSSYYQHESNGNNNFASIALAAADPYFDFTGVQTVAFLLPKDQRIIRVSLQGFYKLNVRNPFQTNESSILNYMLPGNYFDAQGKDYFSYWAHEAGHMFLLPDLYIQPWLPSERPGWENSPGPFNGWDLMANQDGPSRSTSMWTRWLAGWVDDSQVWCNKISNMKNSTFMISPNESSFEGIKVVMIPLSSTKSIVIESRRETQFNIDDARLDEGLLVYEVDTTYGHGDGMILPLRNTSFLQFPGNPPYLDALMKVGETLVYQNLSITYTSKNQWDTFTVSVS